MEASHWLMIWSATVYYEGSVLATKSVTITLCGGWSLVDNLVSNCILWGFHVGHVVCDYYTLWGLVTGWRLWLLHSVGGGHCLTIWSATVARLVRSSCRLESSVERNFLADGASNAWTMSGLRFDSLRGKLTLTTLLFWKGKRMVLKLDLQRF